METLACFDEAVRLWLGVLSIMYDFIVINS